MACEGIRNTGATGGRMSEIRTGELLGWRNLVTGEKWGDGIS